MGTATAVATTTSNSAADHVPPNGNGGAVVAVESGATHSGFDTSTGTQADTGGHPSSFGT